MFSCPCCSREYQRKIYFDRHVNVCKILSQTKRDRKIDIEECDDTPSLRNLYMVVMELANKNKLLEQKIHYLSKWVNVKRKNFNILEFLNTTYKGGIDYQQWLKTINIGREQLEYVFNSNLVDGIVTALKHHIALCNDSPPIRALTSKANIMYVYKNNEWIIFDDEGLNRFIRLIRGQFLNEFDALFYLKI